jgi:protein regulator of cytokinesis 1
MEAVSAADQENRRKPARAGSVPPRATTPVQSGNVSTARTGTVTPAVRSSSSISSQSLPNKRRKLDHSAAKVCGTNRAALSNRRGNDIQGRPTSPPRLRKRTPRSVTLGSSIPKTNTQHHFLGNGRVPSTLGGLGLRSASAGVQGSSMGVHGRSQHFTSKILPGTGAALKMASKIKRESFKPRPSTYNTGLGEAGATGNARWGGSLTSCVKEEE